MDNQPIPLIWTADFILGDKTPEGHDTYYVGEFNCSCVGITQQLHLAQRIADAALSIIAQNKQGIAKLSQQPAKPDGHMYILECRGGSDKAIDGHRRDTIPIANALILQNWSCEPLFYQDSDYD